MKNPVINSEGPIYSKGSYDVFVGASDEDSFSQYLVINRDTNVIEFTTEVTLNYKGWLDSVIKGEEQWQATQDTLDLTTDDNSEGQIKLDLN